MEPLSPILPGNPISQPACLVWNVDPVLASLGPLSLRWYGLCFSLSFFLGAFFLYWQFRRPGLVKETADLPLFFRLVFYLLIGIPLGAFLGHRLLHGWETLLSDPFRTWRFQGGVSGLASHGATLGMFAASFLFSRRAGLRFLEILDRMAFAMAPAAILVRLGNLMNSECVGRESHVVWAFCFPRHDGALIPRHPAQLYEAGFGALMLLTLIVTDRLANGEKRSLGLMAGVYLSGYFTCRFLVEFFKEGEIPFAGSPLNTAQYLSMPLALLGLGLILWSRKRRRPASLPPLRPSPPCSPR